MMVYTNELWNEWSEKIKHRDGLKKYLHFDHRFSFTSHINNLHELVSDRDKISSHSFFPLIKINIKTPRFRYQENDDEYALETKVRPISFASHFDSQIYAWYSFALTRKYQEYIQQKGFADSVLAYRSDLDGKCNIQFAKDIFDYIHLKGTCTAIALDIKGYFDHIDHLGLKKKWCEVSGVEQLPPDQYNLFKSLTRYNFVYKNTLLKHFGIHIKKLVVKPKTLLDLIPAQGLKNKFSLLHERHIIVRNETHQVLPDKFKRYYGIPQGSPMSALLSNIFLIDYDYQMSLKAKKEGFLYQRYCDDIIIICDQKRAPDLQTFAITEINKHHLIIQDKKVELIDFSINSKGLLRGFNRKKLESHTVTELTEANEQLFYKSLQYLGFEFNGQSILIRPASLSRYFRKMRSRIVKTVSMAYSKNAKGDRIFKQQLLHRYTHLGKRNFLHYAYHASLKYYRNSSGQLKEGMDSPAIKRQLSRHFDILMASLRSKNKQRMKSKIADDKLKSKLKK